MLDFTSLRHMLLKFACLPIVPDYSDERYIPIRQRMHEDSFNFEYNGRPENYQVWIHPDGFHHNAGYMSLRIQKVEDRITCLTFRVCATKAGRVYQYTFNFVEGKPAVEMYQGIGHSVAGGCHDWKKVRCIDFVVLDLIEYMLPPQISDYRPDPGPYYVGNISDKPCFVCQTMVPYNWETCGDCRNNVPLEVDA